MEGSVPGFAAGPVLRQRAALPRAARCLARCGLALRSVASRSAVRTQTSLSRRRPPCRVDAGKHLAPPGRDTQGLHWRPLPPLCGSLVQDSPGSSASPGSFFLPAQRLDPESSWIETFANSHVSQSPGAKGDPASTGSSTYTSMGWHCKKLKDSDSANLALALGAEGNIGRPRRRGPHSKANTNEVRIYQGVRDRGTGQGIAWLEMWRSPQVSSDLPC